MRMVWLFGVLLIAGQAQAKVIRGVVSDSTTGEPLPAATVWVVGSYNGTITNSEGEYVLEAFNLPAVVEVSYIGYRSQRHDIDEAAADIQDFALAPVPIELDVIVVTAGETGRSIMRKVIAQKQNWWNALRTFRVEAYSRFVWRNPSGIVAIAESLSDAYWDRERGWREVIKDKRVTENLDFGMELPAARSLNLYEDNIEINGHNLLGVTHPEALDHYDFVLQECRKIDDRVVYDIDVKPKNGLETAFEGRVAVLDSVFVLLEANLAPNQAFLFPPPIREYSVTLCQQFGNFGGRFRFPVGMQQELSVEIGIPGLQFPRFSGRRISRLTGYEVNVELPDSLFERRRKVVVDSVRAERDSLLLRTALAIPLHEIEQEAYTRIDSTMTFAKAFKPDGPLARFIKFDDEEKSTKSAGNGESKGRGNRRRGFPFISRPELWFNRVDGWHLGSKIKAHTKRTGVTLGGAYGFGSRRWSFRGKATARWGAGKRTFASIAGFDGTDVRYRSRLYGRLRMSGRQILGSADYFDYFWRRAGKLTAGYDLRRRRAPDLRFVAGIHIERHRSVEKNTDWQLRGNTDLQRPNPTIDPGRLHSVSLELDAGDQDNRPAFLFGRRRMALAVEHSRPAFGSDFSFTQVRLTLDWRFRTLFKRRLLSNVLDVRVVGSSFIGTLPRQRYDILDTIPIELATFGAFRTWVDRPYEGEKTLGVFWEHNFRTVPFELIGWRWMIERNIGLIVHGGHGRTWLGDRTLAGLDYKPQYLDRFHHEIGMSINGLWDLFRVNLTRRLDTSRFCVSVGMARLF